MTGTDTLAGALVKLQGALPHVTKDATNPHFRSKYADLSTLTDALLPELAKVGLYWVCKPTMQDGVFGLAYELGHESGDGFLGFYPLPTSGTPQQVGSAITYARRYALCAVTGLAPADDDDDGNAAEAGPASGRLSDAERDAAGLMTAAQRAEHNALRRNAPRRGTTERVKAADVDPDADPWTGPAPEDKPGSATAEQVRRLAIVLAKAGITGDDRLATCMSMSGRDLASSKELSYREAADIIGWAEQEAKTDA
jgi:hypothetical protein